MERPPAKATVFVQALGLAVVTASMRDGRSPPEVCAQVGIDPALLGRADVRVAHEDMCRTWTTLAMGDDAFGLRVARVVDAAPQSLVEYVLASAGDARGALRAFVRFQRLLHDASAHRLEEGPVRATLRLGVMPGYALPGAVLDYLAATVVLRFRRAVKGASDPLEIELPRPPFDDEALAAELFRAPVRYGRPHAQVSYPRAFLDAPLVSVDPTLHALLTRELERALGLPAQDPQQVLPRPEPDALSLVRRELRTALPRGDADLGKVARSLNTSARSLQRRLSERGTTFQALVDDARRALAEELLGGQRATVTEAAFTTGFSDVAAFTRAFRRWTGVPPGEWSRSR